MLLTSSSSSAEVNKSTMNDCGKLRIALQGRTHTRCGKIDYMWKSWRLCWRLRNLAAWHSAFICNIVMRTMTGLWLPTHISLAYDIDASRESTCRLAVTGCRYVKERHSYPGIGHKRRLDDIGDTGDTGTVIWRWAGGVKTGCMLYGSGITRFEVANEPAGSMPSRRMTNGGFGREDLLVSHLETSFLSFRHVKFLIRVDKWLEWVHVSPTRRETRHHGKTGIVGKSLDRYL
ncbi:hypothetical protein HD806DRAFT_474587 [Xylariaceae sp. AK1471]|nr:hypothetical protein HD806DRAFT_474587 [Xylariaceae sp. AK1471]